ncbi:hypothetical protein Fcan01_18051 [Folsomia candida]|uniref:Uncharacterized protein n=1 Tax=Folsomia candida TaxID=158441 RepID=A0A226DR40_FOLCA|nr:hypothetical protein Fcan01_18051 [Folsomia candida]
MMMEVEDSCLGSEGRGVMSGRPGGVGGGSTSGKIVSWGRGRLFFLTERIRGVRFACWISEYGPSEEHNPGELCLKDGCGVILRHPSWSGEIALFPPRDNLNLYREYLPEEMKVGQSPRDPEFEVVVGPHMRFLVTARQDREGIYQTRWIPKLSFELGEFARDSDPVEDGRRLAVNTMESTVGSYRGVRVRIPAASFFTEQRLGRVPGREEIAGWRLVSADNYLLRLVWGDYGHLVVPKWAVGINEPEALVAVTSDMKPLPMGGSGYRPPKPTEDRKPRGAVREDPYGWIFGPQYVDVVTLQFIMDYRATILAGVPPGVGGMPYMTDLLNSVTARMVPDTVWNGILEEFAREEVLRTSSEDDDDEDEDEDYQPPDSLMEVNPEEARRNLRPLPHRRDVGHGYVLGHASNFPECRVVLARLPCSEGVPGRVLEPEVEVVDLTSEDGDAAAGGGVASASEVIDLTSDDDATAVGIGEGGSMEVDSERDSTTEEEDLETGCDPAVGDLTAETTRRTGSGAGYAPVSRAAGGVVGPIRTKVRVVPQAVARARMSMKVSVDMGVRAVVPSRAQEAAGPSRPREYMAGSSDEATENSSDEGLECVPVVPVRSVVPRRRRRRIIPYQGSEHPATCPCGHRFRSRERLRHHQRNCRGDYQCAYGMCHLMGCWGNPRGRK